MIEKKQFVPHLLVLLGAAGLAIFFDAVPLVWLLGILSVLVVLGYEIARQTGLKDIFFGIPLFVLTLGAWEWFAIVFGARALQVAPAWIAAMCVIALAGLFAYLLPGITALGRAVCGMLVAVWSVVLLFAPASFFALGVGAAGAFAILALLIHYIEIGATRKKIILTALISLACLVGVGSSFSWFL